MALRNRPLYAHAPHSEASIANTPGTESPFQERKGFHLDLPQNIGPDPFATPGSGRSGINTPRDATPAAIYQNSLNRQYFRSRRVKKSDKPERPWSQVTDSREKWITIIPIIGMLLGLGVAGFLVWDGLRGVTKNQYCLVLEDDFREGFNAAKWTKEAEVGGFGNGEFEQTTLTDENVFVENGMLTIKPTLQDKKLVETDGSTINLLKDGICSSNVWSNCITSTNSTNSTIVQPVKSGRINTSRAKGGKIKYGRVEVEAKLPAGDWLWPAIWMLPLNDTYGPWPESGEIDIMESRGNNHTYAQGGNNVMSSTLHWGPNSANDGWWRTNVKRTALHTTYAKTFHTFGVEWSEKYIFTYVDTILLQVLYTNFQTPLWERGNFPLSDSNGSQIIDPWSQTGRPSTPFDQDFYLIINVAVGGTNGWFQDGKSGKPWVDGSDSAKKNFWAAQDQWYPTWKVGGFMQIKSVKMYQQQGYNGCSNGVSVV